MDFVLLVVPNRNVFLISCFRSLSYPRIPNVNLTRVVLMEFMSSVDYPLTSFERARLDGFFLLRFEMSCMLFVRTACGFMLSCKKT